VVQNTVVKGCFGAFASEIINANAHLANANCNFVKRQTFDSPDVLLRVSGLFGDFFERHYRFQLVCNSSANPHALTERKSLL
jgi:hypothetical protein